MRGRGAGGRRRRGGGAKERDEEEEPGSGMLSARGCDDLRCGLGFTVRGAAFGGWGFRFSVSGFEFRASGTGCRVPCFWFRS